MPPISSQPSLADVVALAGALDREEGRPAEERRERDQRLAPNLPLRSSDPAVTALAWLEAIRSEDETVRRLHHQAQTAVLLTSFFVTLAGVLFGWSATLAAFYFDGSGRVNAVAVLTLLVALPFLLLVPFLIATLPASVAEKIPGAGLLVALARALSPGRLGPLFWRMLPRDLRDALGLLSGRLDRQHRRYGTLQRWAVLRWSQLFAVAFQAAALTACVVLVVFTDLAFGWSTTLTTGDSSEDARRVYRLTSAVAAPWSWALESARPSLALIEESRYYRAAAESVSRAQAARLGGWWRFIAMALVVYGLLPRVLTLVWAEARFRTAARTAVREAPGVSALSRRLQHAQIQTRAVEAEHPAEGSPTGQLTGLATPVAAGASVAVISWSGAPVPPQVQARLRAATKVQRAGGASTVEEDSALAREVSGQAARDRNDVLVVVKAWEPPLLELVDFLQTLRAALDRGRMIIVLPVGLDADAAPSAAQVRVWRDRLSSIGDPWLRVVASPGEVFP